MRSAVALMDSFLKVPTRGGSEQYIMLPSLTVGGRDGYTDVTQTSIGVLLFCGKVYPYATINCFDVSARPHKATYTVFSMEGVHAFMKKYPHFVKSYNERLAARKYYVFGQENSFEATFPRFQKLFERSGVAMEEVNDILISNRVAFMTLAPHDRHHDKVIVTKHPILKSLDFQHHVDPYTTYQEIAMFVGGILPKTEKELYELSNEEQIEKKGFDKHSFRKSPTKHR